MPRETSLNSCACYGKGFCQGSDLLKNECMHMCPTCAKSFRHRVTLTKHARTHTLERPLACPLCAISFSQRATLVRHLCTHTGERLYPCPACGEVPGELPLCAPLEGPRGRRLLADHLRRLSAT